MIQLNQKSKPEMEFDPRNWLEVSLKLTRPKQLCCVSGAVALQSDLSYNSKPHKEISDSRTVIWYRIYSIEKPQRLFSSSRIFGEAFIRGRSLLEGGDYFCLGMYTW